jgi:hypothetical protein
MSLTRPGGLNSGRAGDNEASPSELCSDVACTGAGARSPNNIVRSQAGNGAVNGDSVRTISHAAFTLASIRVLTGEGKMNANLETPQKVSWRVIVRYSAEVSLDVYVVFLRYRNINGPRVRHLPRSIDADVAAMPGETASPEVEGPYSDINCHLAHQKTTVMSYSASLAGSAISRSRGNPSDFSERQNGRHVARRLLRSCRGYPATHASEVLRLVARHSRPGALYGAVFDLRFDWLRWQRSTASPALCAPDVRRRTRTTAP